MGKINGVSNFNGLFTVLNEYGEIRMQLLVPSKSHNCLKPSFDNKMESYRKFNLAIPQVAYNDNVSGDRKFLEKVIPSLKKNVVHVAPSQAEFIDRNNPYSVFLVATIPDHVSATVLDNKEYISIACEGILKIANNGDSHLFVGFDIE